MVKLVPESKEKANEEIEKDVKEESTIPWSKEIVKVTVLECEWALNEIEKIKKALNDYGYSSKAIREILKWYVDVKE